MPNSNISLDQKRHFIQLLSDAGVPEIEIGLPDGVSACLEVADLIHEMRLPIRSTALIPFYTNRWKVQLDQAADHRLDFVDILGPTSDYLLKDPFLYGMKPSEIIARLQPVLEYADAKQLEYGVGLIDATRTPLDRLFPIVEHVRKSGARRLVLYDSVGIMQPTSMKQWIKEFKSVLQKPILVHCHNDYGMATANSLAAIEGGAQAIDVAVNGVGGRAGNAALEEVALALQNLYGLETGVDPRRFRDLSVLTEQLTGVKNSATKPIVGDYTFAHLPVMHIRCIANGNSEAFEAYPPEQVGTERTYHFSLPVDYSSALEPFIRKSGAELNPEKIREVLATLRAQEGYTEHQVIQIIQQVAGGMR
jgi:isopropylmalate/homocitrate/citramalate synthase